MKTVVAALVLCLCSFAARPSSGASFTPLGFLGVDFGPSLALGVSADGSTVVGESNSPQGLQAFRWRPGEGMIGLGDIPGGAFSSIAYACSGDGSVVVGASEDATSGEEGTPFRWTQQSGMVRLGSLGGPTSYGQARAITSDGSVIVGASQAQTGVFGFRWTPGSGMVSLGDFSGGPALSRAYGVSADGNTIAGIGSRSSGFDQAFRWTPGGGLAGIGSNNSALAITPDGLVIAGSDFQGAYRWTQAGGFVHLGRTGGSGVQIVGAMSADGNVIVGLDDYNATQGTGLAFIWDPVHGMRALAQVLMSDHQLDLQGMRVFFAEGVSADGKVIAGYGFDQRGEQEGWVANLEDQSSGVTPRGPSAPVSVARLEQNLPNPFSGSTTISFQLARTAPVSLRLYDGSGRLVKVLLDHAIVAAGAHAEAWDGRAADGRRVAAGTYFCRLESGGQSDSRRVIVVR
jgi:probable HAF family extracellular repeat protein